MSLIKFVDALPILPVLKAKSTRYGIQPYKVSMKQVNLKLLCVNPYIN
ncbi:hypothetical protein [Peribacillus kribbensis]|nr:hypothetical protein [Peribacillus kribbensis]